MGEEPINLSIDDAMNAMLEVVSEPIRRNAEHWSAVHASKGRWGRVPAHVSVFFQRWSISTYLSPSTLGFIPAQSIRSHQKTKRLPQCPGLDSLNNRSLGSLTTATVAVHRM